MLRDEVLADESPLAFRDETIPEWKGRVVRVPELDGLERVDLVDLVTAERPQGRPPTKRETLLEEARIVVSVLRDPANGERAFQDGDAEKLARRHAKVIERLFVVFGELNGFVRKEAEAAAGKGGSAASASPPTA